MLLQKVMGEQGMSMKPELANLEQGESTTPCCDFGTSENVSFKKTKLIGSLNLPQLRKLRNGVCDAESHQNPGCP